MSFSYRRFLLPLLTLWLLFSESLPAQTAVPRSPHPAFATQMGSGLYATRGSIEQIYRVNAAVGLRSSVENRWGALLRLPFTVGFFDYEIMDFFSSGLPQHDVAAFAFLPTLELEHYVSDHWLFAPFAGFGAGIDRQNHFEWLATLGLHNLFILPWRSWDVRFNSRILYSGSLTPALHPSDDFGMFESGVDFRHPLGLELFGMELDGSIFTVNYIYKISPHLLISSANPFQQQVEWEFGVTVGTVHSTYFWGFRLPRVGLSYRFGKDRTAVCIIAGNVFSILSPREKNSQD